MHWVNVPYWEWIVIGLVWQTGVWVGDLVQQRWRHHRAPLFMDLEGAADWAREHSGKLAEFPGGRITWREVRR